ncbi:MAG: hypothetical protein WC760_12655 [Bacteroidia bacterium]|jgi:hypothetical protein
MNRLILFFLIVLSACTVSRLDRFPGQPVPEFPKELQGEYHWMVGGFQGFFQHKKLDSVRIRIFADRIESLEESGWKTEFKIDSSSMLSQYQNLYFISKKDDQEPQFWNSNICWKAGDEIRFSSINASDKALQKDRLKNYLQLTLLTRNKDQMNYREVYAKDVTMLKLLSKIPEGKKDSVVFYQMNEAQLLRYFKREVGNKNTIRFEPIDPVSQKK